MFSKMKLLVLTPLVSLFLPGCTMGENKRDFGLAAYDGPIIDSHSHPRKQNLKQLTRHFADATIAGIERIIVMRTPNDYRKPMKRNKLLTRANKFTNVTILCSGDFVGHLNKGRSKRALREVVDIRKALKDGLCTGIGEVGLRHYDKRWARGGGQPEVIVPLYSPLVLELLAIANQFAVPIVLHIEPVYRPRSIDNTGKVKIWYKDICRRFPRAKFVAAHTGMMSPPDLEELFLACKNLYADIKVLHHRGAIIGFADLYAVNDLEFKWFEHWAKMFEKYPERFMYGSDWKEGRGRWRNKGFSYRNHTKRVRKMIGSLALSVQRKIAYSNAKRIFQLPQ